MRSLSRIECFNVGCTNEASVTINGDHVCTQCAKADLPNEMHKFLVADCANIEVPVAEIAAAKAAGKCGECYACCAGYHEQCKGADHDWYKELGVEAGIEQALEIGRNMAKYGTIDAPAQSIEDILVWPCATWCYREELCTMNHMSDDYTVLYCGSDAYETFCVANNLN